MTTLATLFSGRIQESLKKDEQVVRIPHILSNQHYEYFSCIFALLTKVCCGQSTAIYIEDLSRLSDENMTSTDKLRISHVEFVFRARRNWAIARMVQ